MVYLWLDDLRTPPKKTGISWTWVKNYKQAVDVLKTGQVVFASLDHDLAEEHYLTMIPIQTPWGLAVPKYKFKEPTGLEVLQWIAGNDAWPERGIRIHTQNDVRGPIMQEIVNQQYGRTFQFDIGDEKDGCTEALVLDDFEEWKGEWLDVK